MKTNRRVSSVMVLAVLGLALASGAASLESAPPVVVKSVPVAGSTGVDPALGEIAVTFSKAMQDGSWSWSTWGDENFPELTGKPGYQADGRTCVVPVKLKPGKFYAIWLNSEKFRNFKDRAGNPAVPYLLTFQTAGSRETPAAAAAPAGTPGTADRTAGAELLNADQRTVLEWTDRQFRGFFDGRTFDGWSATERTELETRMLDTLKGPVGRDYYQAINTLVALRATNALPALRTIGLERREKDNRDRWMAIRGLGLIGDRASVPELIHLVYHGNANTRWWAQISLVRITGQNFGSDWGAWGRWWNGQKGEPAYTPEIIRWWNGQSPDGQLAESLAESDRKFLEGIRPK